MQERQRMIITAILAKIKGEVDHITLITKPGERDRIFPYIAMMYTIINLFLEDIKLSPSLIEKSREAHQKFSECFRLMEFMSSGDKEEFDRIIKSLDQIIKKITTKN